MRNKGFIEPLTIEQVENGFAVRVGAERCTAPVYVFQTLEELISFLSQHFTHRSQNIKVDFQMYNPNNTL